MMSKFISNSSQMHLEAIKYIFKYLKYTKDYGLLFNNLLDNNKILIENIDANYEQDLNQTIAICSLCLHLMMNALIGYLSCRSG